MKQKNIIHLGFNLNRARERDADEICTGRLILDGREKANPAASPMVPSGTYILTSTSGQAPGEVEYFGYRQIPDEQP